MSIECINNSDSVFFKNVSFHGNIRKGEFKEEEWHDYST